MGNAVRLSTIILCIMLCHSLLFSQRVIRGGRTTPEIYTPKRNFNLDALRFDSKITTRDLERVGAIHGPFPHENNDVRKVPWDGIHSRKTNEEIDKELDKLFEVYANSKSNAVPGSRENVKTIRELSERISKAFKEYTAKSHVSYYEFDKARFPRIKGKEVFVDINDLQKNDRRFREIAGSFIKDLPSLLSKSFKTKESIFLLSSREKNGDECLTFVQLSESNGNVDVHLKPVQVMNHSDDLSAVLLSAHLKSIKKGARVYVYGDQNSKIDIEGIGSKKGFTIIRRSPTLKKDFLATDERIALLNVKTLNRNETKLLNGIPETENELEQMGLPKLGVDKWREFKQKARELTQLPDANIINSKEQFFQELTSGESDVVFVIAHNDGKSIYFGGNKVAFDEFENLEKREPMAKPRLAVIISCSAGKINQPRNSIFRRNLKSIAETFLKKGFFDEVIAPNHDIDNLESLEVLKEMFDNKDVQMLRRLLKGWHGLAALFEKAKKDVL